MNLIDADNQCRFLIAVPFIDDICEKLRVFSYLAKSDNCPR
jgi:hypothetical protein